MDTYERIRPGDVVVNVRSLHWRTPSARCEVPSGTRILIIAHGGPNVMRASSSPPHWVISNSTRPRHGVGYFVICLAAGFGLFGASWGLGVGFIDVIEHNDRSVARVFGRWV